MRKLLLLLALLASIRPTLAVTRYADASCGTSGDGTNQACGGAQGAFNSVANAKAGTNCGDTVNFKAGTYFSENVSGLTDWSQSCTSGTPLIIQSLNWTAPGAGTQDIVYWENTQHLSAGNWTQCSTCNGADAVPCRGVPGTCTQAWYHTPNSGKKALWGVTPTGGITPRRVSICSAATCTGAGTPCACCTGAGAGATCDGLTSQYDAYSVDASDAILTVKWGASLSASPWTNGEDNVPVTRISGDYVTIRGIKIRYGLNAGVEIASTADHPVVQDCTLAYFNDSGNGSARPIFIDSATNVSILDNTISYSSSEAFHVTTQTSGSVTGTAARNYILGIGDLTTLGPGTAGTPNCTTFTNDAPQAGSTVGDFSGFSFDGNVMNGCGNNTNSSGRKAILFESACDGLTVSNNIMLNVGTCFKFHAYNGGATNHTSGNKVFNNYCINPNIGDQLGVDFRIEGAGPEANNVLMNNTFVGCGGGGLSADNSALITGNIFRNNIWYYNGGIKQVNFSATDATNHFDNSLVYITGAGNAVTWGPAAASYDCAHLNSAGLGTGNINGCQNPAFSNVTNSDYHIQSTSPAIDAGTSIGMPAGHTRDINNVIAASHNLPPYNDNNALFGSAWDIGADEFASGVAPNLKISKTHTPQPVISGNNLTYTISYSNAGSTQTTATTISDTIPANVSFVSANAGGTSNGTTITWSIGVLAGGASGAVQWIGQTATGLSNGTIISNATYSITSNEQGPVAGVSDPATVTALPFLTLAKSDQPDPVLAGSNITYTIAYSNTGTGGATNVVIADVVPVNTTFVSASNGGSLSGSTVTWTIGPVNAGVNASVQLVVQVGAGVAAGSVITNSGYTLASTELPTVVGAPITTSVITSSPTSTNFVLPITQRQNSWSATQTDLFLPNADIVQGPNGAQWIRGQATEEVTLSNGGTTTDSSTNLLPANAFIEAVVARVTTTITVATNWKLGDSTQPGRFTGQISALTAGSTTVGLNHLDPTVASSNLGPVQTSATPVRITTTGTPGAGKIRITVFYRQYIPPGS